MRSFLHAIVFLLVSASTVQAGYDQSKDWFHAKDWRERVRIQFLLVFTGDYAFQVDGTFGKLTYKALTDFQKHRDFYPNGVLDSEQMQILQRDGLDLVERVGFETYLDAIAGLQLGVPGKLFEPFTRTQRGHLWRAYDNSIELETLQVPADETGYAALYKRLTDTSDGRIVEHKRFRNDYFVVSGQQNGRDFYLRMMKTSSDSRGFSLAWQARHAVFMDRVAVAMSNSMTFYDGSGDKKPDDEKLDAVTSAPALKLPEEDSRSTPLPKGARKNAHGQKTTSSGSGYFLTTKGHIGTNAHVVGNCRSLDIPGHGTARLVRADTENDLAILQLDSGKSEHAAQFRSEQPIVRGEEIFVIGYPFAEILDNNLNFTPGMISSLAGVKGDKRHFMVTAPVQPGNSGGPVLDRTGAVIGTVVSRLDTFKTLKLAGDLPENVNFAVRGKLMAKFMEELGLVPRYNTITTLKSPTRIDEEASQYTVLVLCRN